MPRPGYKKKVLKKITLMKKVLCTDSKKSSVTKCHPTSDSIALEQDKVDVEEHLEKSHGSKSIGSAKLFVTAMKSVL